MTGARYRHGQRGGRASVHRYRVEFGIREHVAVARRSEQYGRAVRRPAVNLIVVTPAFGERTRRRIKRELPRRPAARRNHVHLFVAAVLAGESDEASAGREFAE